MGKGLKSFVASAFSPRTIVQKAANYTALLSDDQVTATTAITVTLPSLAAMIGSVSGEKLMKLAAAAAYNLTLSPGATGETIGGNASHVVPMGTSVILKGTRGATNWEIIYPDTSQGLGGVFKQTFVVDTNGTTPVNVYPNGNAMADSIITNIVVVAKDATASNIIVKNGSSTVCTTAKGTTAGLSTAATVANAGVAKGNVLTVESSGTGQASVFISMMPA